MSMTINVVVFLPHPTKGIYFSKAATSFAPYCKGERYCVRLTRYLFEILLHFSTFLGHHFFPPPQEKRAAAWHRPDMAWRLASHPIHLTPRSLVFMTPQFYLIRTSPWKTWGSFTPAKSPLDYLVSCRLLLNLIVPGHILTWISKKNHIWKQSPLPKG